MKIQQRHKETDKRAIEKSALSKWQLKLHEIIFEADTFAGKTFDVLLLVAIVLSILAVMMESVVSFQHQYLYELKVIEWVFTGIFTVEYVLRVICIGKPLKYILSFYGIVDLLAVLPSYVGLFLTGYHSLSIVRSLRLLRVFRIFKLGRFIGEADLILNALKSSRAKITVFLVAVLSVVSIMGTLMYLVESPETGFTSIPRSIYWSIVTLTTVGYGDISPGTPLGQAIASLIMILGYAIIAVPTGIVTSEVSRSMKSDKHDDENISRQACPNCSKEGHDIDAEYCKFCGYHIKTKNT